MATQISSLTDAISQCQNIIIAAMRYTAEHNAVMRGLVEHFTLGQGQKSITVPKAAQATAFSLTEGVDLVDTQDLGLTYLSLTTGEVGLKFIITKKLLRQFNEDVFKIIGRMAGDAMSRKYDRDIIALFSGLNGGTTLGANNLNLNIGLLANCISRATANKYPNPVYVVHHPNALARTAISASGVDNPSALVSYSFGGVPSEEAASYLRNFYKFSVNGIAVFQDGNIDKIGATNSGYGAIFSKNAMCLVESLASETDREQDISLRGWEIVTVSDYGVFELDDTYGAPMRYEIGDLVTTAT